MRALSLVLAAGLSVAGTAHADMAADYAAAYRSIYGEGEADRMAASLRGLAILAGIEGDWAPADLVSNSPVLDTDRVTRGCEMAGRRVTRDGSMGFTIETVSRGELQGDIVRYAFAGGVHFASLADLDGRFNRLFPNQAIGTFPPERLLGTVITPVNHALTRVTMPGPDVLLLEPVGAGAMILTRCPAS